MKRCCIPMLKIYCLPFLSWSTAFCLFPNIWECLEQTHRSQILNSKDVWFKNFHRLSYSRGEHSVGIKWWFLWILSYLYIFSINKWTGFSSSDLLINEVYGEENYFSDIYIDKDIILKIMLTWFFFILYYSTYWYIFIWVQMNISNNISGIFPIQYNAICK